MKRASPSAEMTLSVALTWDGARWPVRSLAPAAKSFLGAATSRVPNSKKMAALLAADVVDELRVCWVPRLKGGVPALAESFVAPRGKRLPFRAIRTRRIGDMLAVVYRRASPRV